MDIFSVHGKVHSLVERDESLFVFGVWYEKVETVCVCRGSAIGHEYVYCSV